MGADYIFAGKFVERSGETLGDLAAVDEENGRGSFADDFKEAGMDGAPDGDALGALGSWPGRKLFLLAEAGHVFDGNLDAQLSCLGALALTMVTGR